MPNEQVAKLRRTIGFFASVIKSGEKWGPVLEERLRAAMSDPQAHAPKLMPHGEYLKVEGLLAMADHHSQILAEIEKAVCDLVGQHYAERDSGHVGDMIYGEIGPSNAIELLKKLGHWVVHNVESPKGTLGLNFNSDFSGDALFVTRSDQGDTVIEVDARTFYVIAKMLTTIEALDVDSAQLQVLMEALVELPIDMQEFIDLSMRILEKYEGPPPKKEE